MPTVVPCPPDRPAANGRGPHPARRRIAAFVILAGVALAANGQSPPPAPDAPRVPPTPQATEDVVTCDGIVRLYLLNEFGDVEGIVARDGTQVRFPPHMGPDLVRALKPGDRFVARGAGVAGRGFRAYALGRVGATPLVEGRPSSVGAPPPPDVRVAALVEMRADDSVASLLYGPRGDIDGVVLADGTIVRLPRSALFDAARLKAGSRFAAVGYGTQNAFGRSLRAEQVGIDGAPPTPLQPRGPEAPGSRRDPAPPIAPVPPIR